MLDTVTAVKEGSLIAGECVDGRGADLCVRDPATSADAFVADGVTTAKAEAGDSYMERRSIYLASPEEPSEPSSSRS